MDLFGIIFQNSFSQIALLSFSIILKISPRKSPIKFMSLNFKTASKTVSKITSKKGKDMKTLIISALCALTLCSVPYGAEARPAQSDTLDRYVIDGEDVTGFDGSQLVGKTIQSYDVSVSKSGRTVYRVHTVTTAPSLSGLQGKLSGISLNLDALKKLEDISFAKIVEMGDEDLDSLKGLEDISFAEIQKMGCGKLEKLKEQIDDLKDELEIYRNISADVMHRPLIIVDGTETGSIPDPQDIASVIVIKPGSKAALEYGDKAGNGVLEINTRKNASLDAANPVVIIDGKEVSSDVMNTLDPEKIQSVTVLKNAEDVKKYTDVPNRGVIVIKTKGK